MSFSKEWTEWRLTPRGWERGSEVLDFGKPTIIEPPKDRVLTTKWSEIQTSAYAKMHRGISEVWRSDDETEIKKLTVEFGQSPETL
jgi:hypothetical protein